MVSVIGLKDNNFISFVEKREKRGNKRPCRSDGNHDIVGRVNRNAIEGAGFLQNTFPQGLNATVVGIDGFISVNGVAGSLLDRVGSGHVTDTLPEVDTVPITQHERDSSDAALLQSFSTFGERFHVSGTIVDSLGI